MALKTSLISYWKLDEASGDALDAHGSNDLTDTNTVGSATGKINNARDFENDNTEYFSHADNSDLTTGDIDFTFACWVQFESGNVSTILNKGDGGSGGGNYEYGLIFWSDSLLYFDVRNSVGALGEVGDVTTRTTGVWYWVCVWHDSVANTLNLQVNAETVNSVSWTTGVDGVLGHPFQIGRGLGSGRSMDGLIDEAAFWKRVLTSDERAEIYNSGSGLSYDLWDVSSTRHNLCLLGVGG